MTAGARPAFTATAWLGMHSPVDVGDARSRVGKPSPDNDRQSQAELRTGE